MRPEDIKRLLGGYATGTLTQAEQEALYAAALEDQGLFDELAREQPLHELLRDPAVRAEMLDAVAERPRRWMWWRPAAAAFAMAAIATLAIVLPRKKAPQAPAAIIAEMKRVEEPPPQRPQLPQPPVTEAPPAAHITVRPLPPQQKSLRAFQPPPEPAAAPAAAPKFDAAPPVLEAPKAAPLPGVAGGVPGGVLGGIAAPPPPRVMEVAPAAPIRNAFAPSAADMVVLQTEAQATAAEQSARARFYGSNTGALRAAKVLNTAAIRPLGLRYRIVRKQGDGFVEADPKQLGTSDTLALRITANVNGFLSLAGAKPVALTAMEPYTSPPLLPGVSELRIVFSTRPQTSASDSGAVATETLSGETFVVNPVATAPALGFTVALKRK